MNAYTRLLLLAAASLPMADAAFAQKLYRWVDDQGVVHYGDRIPPEYANRDRDILNDQGVAVSSEQGELTEEERARKEREAAALEADQAARAEVARRDRMLLETYLTVEDIEDLRDRRLELFDSQIQVTEAYLTDLRARLAGLMSEAEKFKPYSEDPDAAQIPQNLALDISRTQASIASYEENLARAHSEQQKLRTSFDSDIARFRELKGL